MRQRCRGCRKASRCRFCTQYGKKIPLWVRIFRTRPTWCSYMMPRRSQFRGK
ncbi:MAG: hypothetical protein ILP16_11640 [Spirochaetales bacterium]|nr:hypothetical protein [Spirochaetales bacterium]